jgi:hypothetical protein
MGSQQVNTGVAVRWDDASHNEGKKNKLRIRDGGKRGIPRSDNDDFTPARIIVDLKLDFGDEKVGIVDLDNVHLQIAYTDTKPVFGWWNGAKWVRFREENREVTYANNVADITLPAKWPTDPVIGGSP